MSAVRELGAAFDRFDEAASRALKIGRSDLRALNLLENGPLSAGELAEQLDLTSGSITALVNRLEAAGFVRRTQMSEDRRVVGVELQPTVWVTFAQVYAPCGEAVTAVSAGLTDAQRAVSVDTVLAAARAIAAVADQLRDTS